MRPTDGARREGKSQAGATLYTFPADARQRRTPIEIRLDVLSMITREIRRLQDDEQQHGEFSPSLSLALDWLDLLDDWESAA